MIVSLSPFLSDICYTVEIRETWLELISWEAEHSYSTETDISLYQCKVYAYDVDFTTGECCRLVHFVVTLNTCVICVVLCVLFGIQNDYIVCMCSIFGGHSLLYHTLKNDNMFVSPEQEKLHF